jgi:hypothetical protein
MTIWFILAVRVGVPGDIKSIPSLEPRDAQKIEPIYNGRCKLTMF